MVPKSTLLFLVLCLLAQETYGFAGFKSAIYRRISTSLSAVTTKEQITTVAPPMKCGGDGPCDLRTIQAIEARSKKLSLAQPVFIAFPILMAVAAYNLHDQTALQFHKVADAVSALAWDTDQDVMENVKPALNGPVVTSIAILFGTLVASTVGTLIQRNTDIHKLLINNLECIRQAQLLINSFPEPYRSESREIMERFVQDLFYSFSIDDITLESLRAATYPEQLLLVLNRLRKDADASQGAAVGDVTGVALKILDLRGDLIAAIQIRLPVFHYANLTTLGLSICLIFLAMTDGNEAPQLSFAWSLLVGTFSMMISVIYDLNSPLAGMLRIIYSNNNDFMEALAYGKGIQVDDIEE